LTYAFGEIILVMIGILLALQVNNWNLEQTDKKREIKYLTNIVLDLKKDLARLDFLIEFRKTRLIGDQKIIDHINGSPINSVAEIANNVSNSLMEDNFSPNNTTFLELSNSGNLNLLSNETIKVLLLELEELYKINNLNIEHETFDYREYISKPVLKHVSMDQLFPVFLGEKTVEEQGVVLDTFSGLFGNREYKNGLYLMTVMSSGYIAAYENIKMKSETIIELIENQK
jgi:hypothetical protein